MTEAHATTAASANHSTASPALASHFPDLRQQHAAAYLCLWIFLATEILFFGGLFAAYLVYAILYPDGFLEAAAETEIVIGTINTAAMAAIIAPAAKTPGISVCCIGPTRTKGPIGPSDRPRPSRSAGDPDRSTVGVVKTAAKRTPGPVAYRTSISPVPATATGRRCSSVTPEAVRAGRSRPFTPLTSNVTSSLQSARSICA